jgi:hypothetical protein
MRQRLKRLRLRYVARLRRWVGPMVIHPRYEVGDRLYDLRFPGCASVVTSIAANAKGQIIYRLFGFDHDYRESELSERSPSRF